MACNTEGRSRCHSSSFSMGGPQSARGALLKRWFAHSQPTRHTVEATPNSSANIATFQKRKCPHAQKGKETTHTAHFFRLPIFFSATTQQTNTTHDKMPVKGRKLREWAAGWLGDPSRSACIKATDSSQAVPKQKHLRGAFFFVDGCHCHLFCRTTIRLSF